jgi:(4S)-4-hydroxy-5-phosphonooxypentane-2,3-dione isomerase
VLVVNVDVRVKAGLSRAFILETAKNVEQSRAEPGIVAFDLLVDPSDDHHFLLVEIYRNELDPSAHKSTPHYAAWRDAVEPMMLAPRSSSKWSPLVTQYDQ